MKYLILAALLFTTPLMAKSYVVNHDKSQVTFDAVHAEKPFEGEFHTWSADIHFDEDDLASSSVTAIFQTAAIETGNLMFDGTLPTKNWFDVDGYPEAKFQSNSIVKTESGYKAIGDLTIKGISKAIEFDFTLKGDAPVHMRTSFPVNRLEYNIGVESDPNAEWLSRDIQMHIHIEANIIK